MGLLARAIRAEFGPKYLISSVKCRNNAGSCSRETQWQTLYWFCPEQETIFYTDSAANLKGPTALHWQHTASEVNPDPQKWETELLWAGLELLPKLGNFKLHLRYVRAPGRINSPGRSLWLLPHSSLALASRSRVLHDDHRQCSLFFLKLCWQNYLSSPAALSSHHQLWANGIWMEKAWATRNRRSKFFQAHPGLSWDSPESHLKTVVEVTQERKPEPLMRRLWC